VASATIFLQARQPVQATLGVGNVNTTATDLAANPLVVVAEPDPPASLEVVSEDRGLIALSLSNFTQAGQDLAEAFALLTNVPIQRFTIRSEMSKAAGDAFFGFPTLPPTLAPTAQPGAAGAVAGPIVLAQIPPLLYFIRVDIAPGRNTVCPCPCVPGTPATAVAAAIVAGINTGKIAGWAMDVRNGREWLGHANATFLAPPAPEVTSGEAPHFKEGTPAAGPTPTEAWAFSNGTKEIVDGFEADMAAAMDRTAEATATSGGQMPCTNPGDMNTYPCNSPGSLYAEVPRPAKIASKAGSGAWINGDIQR